MKITPSRTMTVTVTPNIEALQPLLLLRCPHHARDRAARAGVWLPVAQALGSPLSVASNLNKGDPILHRVPTCPGQPPILHANGCGIDHAKAESVKAMMEAGKE